MAYGLPRCLQFDGAVKYNRARDVLLVGSNNDRDPAHDTVLQALWPPEVLREGAACQIARCSTSPMSAIIQPERPDSADAIALITELEAHLEPLYPVKSRHGYSVEKLIAQGVAFFVLRDNDIAA